MEKSLKKIINNNVDKIRFGMVGVINTGIDFGLLFVLTSVGMADLSSNFISTTVALTFSFFANKKFTFRDKTNDKMQFVRFLSITLFGLWVIQPIIILLVKPSFGAFIGNDKIVLFIGKLLATCITLVWNYILYKNFVYNRTKK